MKYCPLRSCWNNWTNWWRRKVMFYLQQKRKQEKFFRQSCQNCILRIQMVSLGKTISWKNKRFFKFLSKMFSDFLGISITFVVLICLQIVPASFGLAASGLEVQFTKSASISFLRIQLKLENGTRRAQIPRKPLIFPPPNKQTNRRTNRQTKNFVHTEVPTLDLCVFSTMLLPTELEGRTHLITITRLLLSD